MYLFPIEINSNSNGAQAGESDIYCLNLQINF